MMQDLTNIAFKEEIDGAHAMIDDDINQIEREINGDITSDSVESSNGSSDS